MPARTIPAPGEQAQVVIVGAGFGGLACARALGRAGIDTLVIDRRNHNLFQPLLYQVATAALSPADIAEPIRKTLGRHRSIRVRLGEVTGITGSTLHLADGTSVGFGRLVIATGSDFSYFGHDDWRPVAPGLKTLAEARSIRQRLLAAFEKAEACPDPDERQALLSVAVVGGGPTGVEMAGAIAELGRFMIRRDFRRLRPSDLRVSLIEAGPRILAAFPPHLSDYAADRLRRSGVELRLGQQVERITQGRMTVAGADIAVGCVIWAAGVKPSPAAAWLGLDGVAKGRVPVDHRFAVKDRPTVFAIGDTAAVTPPLPGLAQVARQQGEWLGAALVADQTGRPPPAPFRFRNRGNTAVIGRNAAIFDFGSWSLTGRPAWYLWALVHVALLINFEKRVLVMVQWTVRYVTGQRGARLIDEDPTAPRPQPPQDAP